MVTRKCTKAEREADEYIIAASTREGGFHKLSPQLIESLVQAARDDASNSRKRFDSALKNQHAAR